MGLLHAWKASGDTRRRESIAVRLAAAAAPLLLLKLVKLTLSTCHIAHAGDIPGADSEEDRSTAAVVSRDRVEAQTCAIV